MQTNEIIEKAEEFCKKHNLTGYPVKIVDLCLAEDIQVFERYLPEEVSGFIVIQEEVFDGYGTGRLIVVNLADSPRRRRFTIAHELAHYILHKDENLSYYAHRDAGQNGGDEKEANLFASNVLMPHTFVNECVERLGEPPQYLLIDYVADKFAVSKDAAQVRLSQLFPKICRCGRKSRRFRCSLRRRRMTSLSRFSFGSLSDIGTCPPARSG